MTAIWRALPIGLLLLLPAAGADPLAGYYDNTLICLGNAGQDLCHLWLEQDGSFVLFGDRQAARTGRFTRAAPQADGTSPVCLAGQTTTIAVPPDLATPTPPPLDRFAANPCVNLAPHVPGDRWTDPSGFRFLLLPGQQ